MNLANKLRYLPPGSESIYYYKSMFSHSNTFFWVEDYRMKDDYNSELMSVWPNDDRLVLSYKLMKNGISRWMLHQNGVKKFLSIKDTPDDTIHVMSYDGDIIVSYNTFGLMGHCINVVVFRKDEQILKTYKSYEVFNDKLKIIIRDNIIYYNGANLVFDCNSHQLEYNTATCYDRTITQKGIKYTLDYLNNIKVDYKGKQINVHTNGSIADYQVYHTDDNFFMIKKNDCRIWYKLYLSPIRECYEYQDVSDDKSDMEIHCNGNIYKVHKEKLCQIKFFQSSMNYDQSNIVVLDQESPQVIENFLMYLYHGNRSMNDESLCELLLFADFINYPELMDECMYRIYPIGFFNENILMMLLPHIKTSKIQDMLMDWLWVNATNIKMQAEHVKKYLDMETVLSILTMKNNVFHWSFKVNGRQLKFDENDMLVKV